MRKILESLKKKGALMKLAGGIVAILGVLISYTGTQVEKEAEKGLMILDQSKLGEARLK